jgi:hypothetical protein
MWQEGSSSIIMLVIYEVLKVWQDWSSGFPLPSQGKGIKEELKEECGRGWRCRIAGDSQIPHHQSFRMTISAQRPADTW